MTDRNPGMTRIGRATLLISSLIACGTFLPSTHAGGSDEPGKVAWRTDLGSAQAEARTRDRLLWIQFTGPWCGNCRRMERGAFAHEPVVVESRERFVPVKLRADEHEDLTASLGLSVLPSTVIVRPNGEVVDKFEGLGEPAEFAEFLRVTLAAEGRSPEQVAARTRKAATPASASTPTPAQALARSDSPRDAGLALAGYDPVRMLQTGKLVPGRSDLAIEHDGQTFRFANEADRAAFVQRPTAFAPINGGRCPVSQVDRGDIAPGDPRWGVVYNGHLYLFRDLGDRDRFAHDPERYAGVDRSAQTTCPHCRQRASLSQRLGNRFSSMFASRSATAPAMPPPTATATATPIGTDPALSPSEADPATTRSLTTRLAALLTTDPAVRR